jgi:predicted transcriptional regulator
MEMSKALAVATGLADPSRLALVNALVGKPHYVEELAQRLQMAPSKVSFHLKKLEQAGLVSKTRDQYYRVYSINRDILDLTLLQLVSADDIEKNLQEERVQTYRNRVIRSFFEGGRLIRLPVQKKKRRIVLEVFASSFLSGRDYREDEVNHIIAGKYGDYCTVRRELVDERILTRKDGMYRCDTEHTADQGDGDLKARPHRECDMDERTAAKRRYKENPPPAGVFRITNKANGKIFIGKGMNVQGKLNGQQSQLKWGSHRNRGMQEDWNHFGPEQFSFEVLDYLPPPTDPRQDPQADLDALEQLWLSKLEPYGEKGYNDTPVKR